MTNEDGRALLVELLHRIAPEADLAEVDPEAPIKRHSTSTPWTT